MPELKLVNSISEVSDSIIAFSSKREELLIPKEQPFRGGLISSISIFKSLLSKYEKSNLKQGRSKNKNYDKEISSICNISQLVCDHIKKHEFSIEEINHQPSILKFIDRGSDENLHSDFLITLFDDYKMGDFSQNLLNNLLSNIYSDYATSERGYINVYRERRLDEIDNNLSGSDIGARRIDLLIEFNSQILVIENKVDTFESTNQTRDYFQVVEQGYSKSKRRYYLFLSPTGARAEEKHFKGISYFELYSIIKKTQEESQLEEQQSIFVDFYRNELRKTILRKMRQIILNSEMYLRRK